MTYSCELLNRTSFHPLEVVKLLCRLRLCFGFDKETLCFYLWMSPRQSGCQRFYNRHMSVASVALPMRRLHMCRPCRCKCRRWLCCRHLCSSMRVRRLQVLLPIVVRWHILRVYRVQVGGLLSFSSLTNFVYCATLFNDIYSMW